MMRGRGRPKGAKSTCSFCGERGHNSTMGSCSGVELAIQMVLAGSSQSESARQSGIFHQCVSGELKRRGLR